MTEEPVSTRSSGNPYADLEMSDADERLAKAQVALRIVVIMRERGLTQAQLAEELGIDQPQVSRITRGQLGPFSLEKLMKLANCLNQDIDIIMRDNPEPARPARMVAWAETDSHAMPLAASSPNGSKMSFD